MQVQSRIKFNNQIQKITLMHAKIPSHNLQLNHHHRKVNLHLVISVVVLGNVKFSRILFSVIVQHSIQDNSVNIPKSKGVTYSNPCRFSMMNSKDLVLEMIISMNSSKQSKHLHSFMMWLTLRYSIVSVRTLGHCYIFPRLKGMHCKCFWVQ